jgi:hypothetical protein
MLRGVIGKGILETPDGGMAASLSRLYCEKLERLRGDDVVRDDPPRPYVIEWTPGPGRVVPAGGAFDFDLVLFGPWGAQVVALTDSVARGAEAGLGSARVPHRLDGVRVVDAGVSIAALRRERPASSALEFVTPLRLAKSPAEARRITGARLVLAMHRRARMLAHFYGALPLPPADPGFRALAEECTLEATRLRWVSVDRASTTQRKTIPISGYVGRCTLAGPVAGLTPLLHAAETIHVGRHASLGHGKVVEIRGAHAPTTERRSEAPRVQRGPRQ